VLLRSIDHRLITLPANYRGPNLPRGANSGYGSLLARTLMVAFMRPAGAWLDAPGTRATVIFLILFVLVWTLFQVLSFASTDLQPDFLEIYAWSRHPSFGYHKHPPLGAWITAIWFSVFPVSDWAFRLLAMVNSATALFAIDLIGRRFLSGDKRLTVLLLLLLTPFYQFRGEPFGANQTLISTWPVAVYCFLRAFESRRAGWAVATGVAAALSMLGKYYSAFLMIGFIVAALAHPNRFAYFRSSSPWISAFVGFALMAPHFVWLSGNGYLPFHYALGAHAGASFNAVLLQAGTYAVGAIGYVAVLFATYLLAVRPDRVALREALWPSDPDRRMLAVLLWFPLVAPIPVAIATGELLTSLWTMQAWFLLPVLLLAPRVVVLRRSAAIGIAALVMAISLGAVLASPALAWFRLTEGSKNSQSYFRLLAIEAVTRWEAATDRPLSIVVGDPDLTAATTFYAKSHPDALPYFDLRAAPWITPARMAAEGWVALCQSDDAECLTRALQLAREQPDAVRADLRLVPRFLGMSGPPRNYTVLLVPPVQPAAH
jgi:4-amino-4-deoxy-L-arabinose transferase-like glycosyltransferase